MEEKINIAEILKDKPQGTKLYDLLYNVDVELCAVGDIDTGAEILCTNKTDYDSNCYHGYSEFGTLVGYPDGLQTLLPSKDMRDWRKFAWKRGDILLSKDNDVYVIFEKFEDDAYTRFKGKHYLWKKLDEEDYSKGESQMLTSLFEKVNDHEAQTYINTIEERLGGKLNRETLEIEKAQPEFKDGDIVTITPQIGNNLIFIFRKEDIEKYFCHAFLDGNIAIVNGDCYCEKEFSTVRLSTEAEKQQLFSALAKKGKTWDAEKKMIVDLKPKIELKPFDKVLVRDGKNEIWEPAFFFRNLSHLNVYNYQTVGGEPRVYCIPFNEETAKLIGTTDDWEG